MGALKDRWEIRILRDRLGLLNPTSSGVICRKSMILCGLDTKCGVDVHFPGEKVHSFALILRGICDF